MKFWRHNGEIYSLENIKSVEHSTPGHILITYKDFSEKSGYMIKGVQVGKTRADAAQALDEIAKILEGE